MERGVFTLSLDFELIWGTLGDYGPTAFRGAVERVCGALTAAGIRTELLRVSHAFHSALMEPMLEEFGRVAGEVSYSAPKKGLISNVTGAMAGEEVCGAEYWRRHAREAVRFADDG